MKASGNPSKPHVRASYSQTFERLASSVALYSVQLKKEVRSQSFASRKRKLEVSTSIPHNSTTTIWNLLFQALQTDHLISHQSPRHLLLQMPQTSYTKYSDSNIVTLVRPNPSASILLSRSLANLNQRNSTSCNLTGSKHRKNTTSTVKFVRISLAIEN